MKEYHDLFSAGDPRVHDLPIEHVVLAADDRHHHRAKLAPLGFMHGDGVPEPQLHQVLRGVGDDEVVRERHGHEPGADLHDRPDPPVAHLEFLVVLDMTDLVPHAPAPIEDGHSLPMGVQGLLEGDIQGLGPAGPGVHQGDDLDIAPGVETARGHAVADEGYDLMGDLLRGGRRGQVLLGHRDREEVLTLQS